VRPLWLNSNCAEKEEAQEVQRDKRREGGVAGRAGDAQAGAARREQETIQERQAQTQPGQASGGRGSVKRLLAFGSSVLAIGFWLLPSGY